VERLDDARYISKLDKSNMLHLIEALPDQFGAALAIFRKSGFRLKGKYDSVVVAGMGGSAIGGDIAGSYFLGRLPVPLIVLRDYDLPAFVDEKTLFVAVSYSGNTEETLAALKEARDRRSDAVCIGSGGVMADLSLSESLPVIPVPGGMPPRCAVAHLATSVILAVSNAFNIPGSTEEIEEAGAVLGEMEKELTPSRPAKDNLAKLIASKFTHRLPFVYSSSRFTDPVARRWSTQMNENAKTLCHYNMLPELDHNEIVGWGIPRDVSYESCVVFLDPGDLSPRHRKRLKVTGDVISQMAAVETVAARGAGRLSRLFSLVYVGDYVSFYLAMLNGVDPTPIERIDYLKRKLKEED
jgi:glucose/mannose-6-phosphate isomerase